MKRAFITGIRGFAGSHLATCCGAAGAEVAGLSRAAAADGIYQGDLDDPDALRRILADARPEIVFHLAAETGGADSERLHRTNVIGTKHLIEAAAALPEPPRIVLASSSAVYGRGPADGSAITEGAPLAPLAPYGESKARQDSIAEALGRELGIDVVRVRAFNQTGPGESELFVAGSIARQIAEIEAGCRAPILSVGRTDTVRDFTDVRDVARGYLLAALHGRAGEAYNLASGSGVSIREIVDLLLASAAVAIEERHDPARMRASDVPVQVGDATKAKKELGWSTEIPLSTTLRDLLDYWRCNIPRV